MQVKPMLALSLCAAALAVAACSNPATPDPQQPPEPEVAGQSAAARAIHEPLDKAKAVEAATQQAADAQRQAIEDAGG